MHNKSEHRMNVLGDASGERTPAHIGRSTFTFRSSNLTYGRKEEILCLNAKRLERVDG